MRTRCGLGPFARPARPRARGRGTDAAIRRELAVNFGGIAADRGFPGATGSTRCASRPSRRRSSGVQEASSTPVASSRGSGNGVLDLRASASRNESRRMRRMRSRWNSVRCVFRPGWWRTRPCAIALRRLEIAGVDPETLTGFVGTTPPSNASASRREYDARHHADAESRRGSDDWRTDKAPHLQKGKRSAMY